MSDNTITLPLPESTRRKLRALAMLSGQNVGNIETELSGYLDKIITERCAELLGIESGITFQYNVASDATDEHLGQDKEPPRRSFADVHKEAAAGEQVAPAVEEAFAGIGIQDDISGHELSGDEDLGENKSLQEQVEADDDPELAAQLRAALPKVKVKKAAEEPEEFVENFYDGSEDDDEVHVNEKARKASSSFEQRMKRGGIGAKVQNYTG